MLLAVAYFIDDFLQWRNGRNIPDVAGIVVGPRDLGTVTWAVRREGTPGIERGSAVGGVGPIDGNGAVRHSRCVLPDE